MQVAVCIYSYIAINLAYSVIFFPVVYDLFLYCHGIALLAVSALFSLAVLLITYCVVKSHSILLFEQINKEKRKRKKKVTIS